MGKQRNTTIIIGEGPTEFYYLNSLKDEFRILQHIKPDSPKNTSLRELQRSIESSIQMGYSQVFCLIDMDTKKKDAKSMAEYQRLKKKYHNAHIVKKCSGIDCQIRFYETERCTELFFIYYFKYTTQKFQTSDDVETLLNKICGYDKTLKFFRGHPLHQFFEKQGGNFVNAIANANRSLFDVRNGNRDYTYSEIGSMFNDLGIE
uniref:RloB family protein n=1 Tax=Prevotella sp. TaxID=59823 RepID=UPI0040299DBF